MAPNWPKYVYLEVTLELFSNSPETQSHLVRVSLGLQWTKHFPSQDIATSLGRARPKNWPKWPMQTIIERRGPVGKQTIRRSRLQYLDYVEKDLRNISVRRWRIKAQDRTEWKRVLEKAGPTTGCRANDNDLITQINLFNLLIQKTTIIVKY